MTKIISLMVAGVLLASMNTMARAGKVDGVAAFVDSEIITIGDVRDAAEPILQKLRLEYKGEEQSRRIRSVYTNVLQKLIDRKLILQSFSRSGIPLDDKIIDRRINEMISERFQNDHAALQEQLAKEGITYDEWRKQIREQIVINSMRNREVEAKLIITPEQLRHYYQQNAKEYWLPEKIRLRVIVIHGGIDVEEQSIRRKLAEDTMSKVMEGQDFSQLAVARSEDGRAPNGGDWGWMEVTDLRKEIQHSIRSKPAGTIIPLLQLEGDWYLVKIEERIAESSIPFEEARKDIEARLRNRESTRLYDAWMKRLRKEFHVQLVDGLFG